MLPHLLTRTEFERRNIGFLGNVAICLPNFTASHFYSHRHESLRYQVNNEYSLFWEKLNWWQMWNWCQWRCRQRMLSDGPRGMQSVGACLSRLWLKLFIHVNAAGPWWRMQIESTEQHFTHTDTGCVGNCFKFNVYPEYAWDTFILTERFFVWTCETEPRLWCSGQGDGKFKVQSSV